MKGDLSGLAGKGDKGTWVEQRLEALGEPFEPQAFPVEYYSLGGLGPGAPIRVTVSDFGPLLLAKILDANKTQEQSLSLLFHYADQKGLPLVDLSDLRAMLQFLDSDEGRGELKGIGGVSSATVGVLLRALVQVEDGGGNELFGEPQLDINDLIRTDADGRGVISLLELGDVRDKPLLWSTATMWLLGELFETLPEVGDLPKPKLVFFFDEAHLLFKDASKAFVEAVVGTARLIRSKGVGVFFVTQTPKDVHADVLAQLGSRVQHALRAHTPDDAKALRAAVRTYPKSEDYDLEELLPQLAIGEAVVTVLDERGVPTPVAHTSIRPPRSKLEPMGNVAEVAKASPLYAKYGTRIDKESAREMLARRLEQATDWDVKVPPPPKPSPQPKRAAADAKQEGRRRRGRRHPPLARGPHDPPRDRPRPHGPAAPQYALALRGPQRAEERPVAGGRALAADPALERHLLDREAVRRRRLHRRSRGSAAGASAGSACAPPSSGRRA